jgi:hypothetical protein
VAGGPPADQLRYSAYTRLQARQARIPAIKQAKSIMAWCAWGGAGDHPDRVWVLSMLAHC